MSPLRLFSAVVLCLVFGGCAVGNRFDYRTITVTAPRAAGPAKIAVAAIDIRPDLLSREVDSNYVGMTRGGYGNPFRVSTKSGNPLAQDLAEVVAAGLKSRGWNAAALSGYSISSREAAVAAFGASGADRLLLLTVRGWESDTLINTEMTVDVGVTVIDRSGKELAATALAVSRSLGGNFAAPIQHGRKSVIDESGRILSQLLTTGPVAKAL